MATTKHVLEQLQLLQRLIQTDEELDEAIEVTVSKLINYELEKYRERQSQLEKKLAVFEERYHLKTKDFQEQFRAGTLGDDMDFFEWAALADLHRELSELTVAEPASHASHHSDSAE
jgi:ABC-type phosphate transport system auxiliary subunit